ncbi:MAG: hypothetical protein RI897_3745 [Verrucomicrobiota bacterium]
MAERFKKSGIGGFGEVEGVAAAAELDRGARGELGLDLAVGGEFHLHA